MPHPVPPPPLKARCGSDYRTPGAPSVTDLRLPADVWPVPPPGMRLQA